MKGTAAAPAGAASPQSAPDARAGRRRYTSINARIHARALPASTLLVDRRMNTTKNRRRRSPSLTIDITWQRGDVAIVDNTRCLHGRRAFAGAAREILIRMGDARLPCQRVATMKKRGKRRSTLPSARGG